MSNPMKSGDHRLDDLGIPYTRNGSNVEEESIFFCIGDKRCTWKGEKGQIRRKI